MVNASDSSSNLQWRIQGGGTQGTFPPPRAVKLCRAGGNGTAGTAMAVPVLREKKWRRLDSNLRVRYRMASPSG